jgi:predicted SAM-dependent methyltransferase
MTAILSKRTRAALKFDLLRLYARIRHQVRGQSTPPFPRLHFGCGRRHIDEWTNVDVAGSPFDIDLTTPLPWPAEVFDSIVAQQVIEHLELEGELLPLLRELARVAKPNAEIWLSCPDMAKVCEAYSSDRGVELKRDRERRWTVKWLAGMPSSHIINVLFHQGNEHKNLYDFELLSWILTQAGFDDPRRSSESEFRTRFPVFPVRDDDQHGLYVTARRRHVASASAAA